MFLKEWENLRNTFCLNSINSHCWLKTVPLNDTLGSTTLKWKVLIDETIRVHLENSNGFEIMAASAIGFLNCNIGNKKIYFMYLTLACCKSQMGFSSRWPLALCDPRINTAHKDNRQKQWSTWRHQKNIYKKYMSQKPPVQRGLSRREWNLLENSLFFFNYAIVQM